MKASLLFVALVLCVPSVLSAKQTPGCAAKTVENGRRLERVITVDGMVRTYILDVPDGVKPEMPTPVMFDFHGFGHSGAGVWKVSAFKAIAEKDPFITVYPDGLSVHLMGRDGSGWDIFTHESNRELAFVRAMLDALESSYCVDSRRVFSTGFSNGAFLSHLLACTMADRIAAIAPVGGGALPIPCVPSRPVPTLIHHGRNDAIVPVERARKLRDVWVEKNACTERVEQDCEWRRSCRDGAEVGYCEDDSEHHWPVAASQRIWSFFREHPMPAPAAPVTAAP